MAMKCAKCKSSRIQVMQSGINTKQQTVLNVNPLQPFTILKHKQKKKLSVAKTTAAVMTGGMSALVTGGIRKNTQFEVFCTDCGNRWKTS